MALIDNNAAIDALIHAFQESLSGGLYPEEMRKAIFSVPTIGAEPVIRCKDCKHFYYDMPYVIQGIPVLGHEVCDFWGGGCKTSENGYCSYAERRTDADE